MSNQYIFLNCTPGMRWTQNRPTSIDDALFKEPLDAVGVSGGPKGDGGETARLGLAFVFSYHDGVTETLEDSLRRLFALSERWATPILITLDGQNWWGQRPDLWNWFDPAKPGFDSANRANVEWTGWEPETAVKVCWRNWGRQIRVLPQPNLSAPRFREESRIALLQLASVVREWKESLPEGMRYLCPGVKIGWEASIGINAFHYPGGNAIFDRSPTDASADPSTGMNLQRDFAGGLARLGYAAMVARGARHGRPIELADHERIVADYLRFLAGVCRQAGFGADEIFTHAGGQYAPWNLHYSHRIAINDDSTPGWSLYFTTPSSAGDLDMALERAHRTDWCAAEWLAAAQDAAAWTDAYRRTLAFRRCRFVDVYNWEGIRAQSGSVAGLRAVLAGTA